MAETTPNDAGVLKHLFDATLMHDPNIAPIASDGDGQLIGSGAGAVKGRDISGGLRWTLFENPGPLVCSMNPVLVLATDDGATIRIEGRGYARRDTESESRWRVAATLRFDTSDPRYEWLNGALAFWEGQFLADQGTATYRAYSPALPPASRQMAAAGPA